MTPQSTPPEDQAPATSFAIARAEGMSAPRKNIDDISVLVEDEQAARSLLRCVIKRRLSIELATLSASLPFAAVWIAGYWDYAMPLYAKVIAYGLMAVALPASIFRNRLAIAIEARRLHVSHSVALDAWSRTSTARIGAFMKGSETQVDEMLTQLLKSTVKNPDPSPASAPQGPRVDSE